MSQHESTAVVVVPNCVARQCQVATCVALLCCYEFRVRLSFACAAPTAYVNRRPTLAPCPFARLGAIEKMVKPRSPQRPSRAQEALKFSSYPAESAPSDYPEGSLQGEPHQPIQRRCLDEGMPECPSGRSRWPLGIGDPRCRGWTRVRTLLRLDFRRGPGNHFEWILARGLPLLHLFLLLAPT